MIRNIGLGAGAVLCLAGLLLTGIVGTPDTVRWIAITGLACLVVAWGLVSLVRGRPLSFTAPMLLAVLFLAWAWLSLCWSQDWKQGLVHVVNMTALGIVYLGVSSVSRETLRAWVPKIAFLAVAGALYLQWRWPEARGGFGNDNWQTEFLLLILPLLGALAFAVGTSSLTMVLAATGLFIGALVYLFSPGGSYVKWLCLMAFGIAAIFAWWRLGHRLSSTIGGLILLNVAIWVLVVDPGMLARKVTQRVELGLNTMAMWADSPIIGQGLGSFNHEYGRFAEWHLRLFPGMDTFMRPMHLFAGQAHNDWIQLLAELGLCGFGLAAWFIWRTWRARRSWDGLDFAAAWSLGAAATVGLVAFPMQNPWTALLIATSLAILGQGGIFSPIKLSSWFVRAPAGLASVAVAGGLVFMAYGNFWSKAAFFWTRELIEKDAATALGANLTAIRWWPFDAHARLQVAMSLANLMSRFQSCEREPDQTKQCLSIQPSAADKINVMAMSAAPYSQTVLLARINYLIFSGRDTERRDEIESDLAWLKDNAALQATVWLTEAHWAGSHGDAPRMAYALQRGYPMAKDPEAYYRPQFEQMAAMLVAEEIQP